MIKIFADSTCDLSKDLLERYDISVIPLYIQLEDKSYRDLIEVTPDDLYEWSNKTGKTPKTSSPDIEYVIEKFKEYDIEGNEIIYIGISEELSTTCNVVRLAAEELEYARAYIIDSRSLSTGIGLQLIKAAEYIQQGMNAKSIVAKIISERENVRAGFVIDTLTYLHRGGRCSAITALVAGALKLKPQIVVADGKMDVGKKFRGNIDSVIHKYVEELKEDILNAEENHIFITHSGGVEDIAGEVKKNLEKLGIFKEIHITRAGSVIASHCGPRTLGVLFYAKRI